MSLICSRGPYSLHDWSFWTLFLCYGWVGESYCLHLLHTHTMSLYSIHLTNRRVGLGSNSHDKIFRALETSKQTKTKECSNWHINYPDNHALLFLKELLRTSLRAYLFLRNFQLQWKPQELTITIALTCIALYSLPSIFLDIVYLHVWHEYLDDLFESSR